MKFQIGMLALLLFFILSPAQSQDCSANGDVQFLCGPVSPEDLVKIPETQWIVAAGMEDDGYLHLIDSKALSSQSVYPSANNISEWDQDLYGNCSGPMADGFRPHGLHLVPGENGQHKLLVVRHGARESIEVFNIDSSESVPSFTWIGCVEAPEEVVFNSVAATPEGGMVATHFQLPMGVVYEWKPQSDWEKVPGSETSGPNGIEISPEGDWLYIGGWGTRTLIKLSRGRNPAVVESVAVSHHIDNVRWADDGSLLAAGHVGPLPTSILNCLSQQQCEGVSSRVSRVDIDDLTAEQIIDYPSDSDFILGTVAIEVGDEVWVGGIAGGDRIARFKIQQ